MIHSWHKAMLLGSLGLGVLGASGTSPARGAGDEGPAVLFRSAPVAHARLAGDGAAAQVRGIAAPGSVVTGAPYSAVGRSRTVTTLADGNRIVREHVMRYYRDGEGRTRIEHELAGVGPFALAEPRVIVMINDPVAGEHIVLHPQEKRADVLPGGAFVMAAPAVAGAPAIAAAPVPAPGGNVLVGPGPAPGIRVAAPPPHGTRMQRPLPGSVSLGERTISGLKVQGSRVELQIPAGQIGNDLPLTVRTEQWFSPELGVVVASTHDDPLIGRTTFELEQILRREPDAALFEVPADYARNELPRPFERELPPPH